jgi:hypothetical protein
MLGAYGREVKNAPMKIWKSEGIKGSGRACSISRTRKAFSGRGKYAMIPNGGKVS